MAQVFQAAKKPLAPNRWVSVKTMSPCGFDFKFPCRLVSSDDLFQNSSFAEWLKAMTSILYPLYRQENCFEKLNKLSFQRASNTTLREFARKVPPSR